MATYAQRIASRVNALAACLCASIPAEDAEKMCLCGVIPGAANIASYAGTAGDMAWVRLLNAYPSNQPGQLAQALGNCDSSRGMDVEIGILRCYDIPEDGEALSQEQVNEMSAIQLADLGYIWSAVSCCGSDPNDPDHWTSKDWLMANYVPLGPDGGLYGGQITLYMTL